jgi:hypothetical protein
VRFDATILFSSSEDPPLNETTLRENDRVGSCFHLIVRHHPTAITERCGWVSNPSTMYSRCLSSDPQPASHYPHTGFLAFPQSLHSHELTPPPRHSPLIINLQRFYAGARRKVDR